MGKLWIYIFFPELPHFCRFFLNSADRMPNVLQFDQTMITKFTNQNLMYCDTTDISYPIFFYRRSTQSDFNTQTNDYLDLLCYWAYEESMY